MTSSDQLFIPDKSPSCPVTGLSITSKPDWTDIQLDSDFSVTFSIIGKAILLITPKGKSSDEGTKALLEKITEIIHEAGLTGRNYAELRDYRLLTGTPSKEGRMAVINFLLKETSEGYLQGFWVFGAPLLLRFILQVGLRLHKFPVPVGIVKDYREAVQNALMVLRQSGVDVGSKLYPRLRKDGWALEIEEYGISFELIGDDILYTIARGRLKEPHVEKFFELHEKVLQEAGLTQKGYYYRIMNWERFEGIPWKARSMYIEGFKELNKKTRCRVSVIFGLNKFMKLLVAINRPFVSIPVMVAKDFPDALEIMERERDRVRRPKSALKIEKQKVKTYTEEQLNGFADEMLKVIGGINWDQAGISLDNMSEEHPLKPVLDALAVVKLDLDNLFQEKKKSQESLHESEEKYRLLVENANEALYVLQDGIFRYANRMCGEVLGVPVGELIGLSMLEFLNPDDREKAISQHLRILRGEQAAGRTDFRVLTRYGEERWADVNSVGIVWDGKTATLNFATDITDSKQAEEKLRESEEKYRNILESIEDGYFEVDLAGNFTFFNPSLCVILGYPGEEMPGMNNRSYMDPENAKMVLRAFNEVYVTGAPKKGFEWEVIQKNGARRHIEVSVSLILSPEGKPTGFRGVARDVTERKMIEATEQAKLRAEAANKAKSQFLANVSHEIRTPLNGIMGMAEVCLKTKLDEDQKHIVGTITKEANSLLGIINEILDFSKIEAGKLEIERIPFDLRNLFEDVAESFSFQTAQKGLELISSVSPKTPTRIVGDPGRLRQVLRNLISNAIKFTHEGRIVVKAEPDGDTLPQGVPGIKLRFLVKDTGIGIPKEKQAIVFESFTQADGSTTRKYGGTGLGITISKQLAELMGGEIGVDSEEGKGSTFWFTSVFSKQSEKDLQTRKEAPLDNLRVLVVDDNKTNRETMAEYLRSWGSVPVEAASAKEALSILKGAIAGGERVNLVLSDLNIPEMNGFDLAREIRSVESFKSIPIVVFTPFGNPGDGKICRDIGIEGYLTKPIREKELRRIIESVLWPSMSGESGSEIDLVTKYTSAEVDRKEIRILLVEDYPTNQEIAKRHLEHAGYQVDLAENGKLAVEEFRRKHYDLILMDIQMPVMDGYQATKAIREIESELAALENKNAAETMHRVPIIAMTAHAQSEYKELCIEAGMDDFLSKPLTQKEMFSMAAKWLEESSKSASIGGHDAASCPPMQDVSPTEVRSGKPIDLEKAIAEFEGDKKLLSEVIAGFTEKVIEQIGTIRKALSCGDADTVKREAHAIKGGAASLTAADLSKVASDLESKGKSKDLHGTDEILDDLEREFEALRGYIQENFPP